MKSIIFVMAFFIGSPLWASSEKECEPIEDNFVIEGKSYPVRELKIGEEVKGGFIFVVNCKASNTSSNLSIGSDLHSFNSDYIYNIFFEQNPEIVNFFPFYAVGVESILSEKEMKLIFKVHENISLNVNKVLAFFNSNKVDFKVLDIVGKVYITSSDLRSVKKLESFESAYRVPKNTLFSRKENENGSTTSIYTFDDNEFPKTFKPKVLYEK